MAKDALNLAVLPAHGELQAFSRVVAHLLAEHPTPAPGPRTIKRRAGPGLQHLDPRDYLPGDEVRHIDWRQTARRRRPIVRQFEAETTGDWFLLLDASSSMSFGDAAKWRAAVNAIAAMAYSLLALGHRVALVCFGSDVIAECRPGRGAAHYPALARTLATSRPQARGVGSNLASCVRRLIGTASAFVVSDFLGVGELRLDLAALRERCVALHALQVTDVAELRAPGPGSVELVDIESGETRSSHTGALAETAAHLEREQMSQRLQGFCLRNAIAFSRWDLTLPWQRLLVDHLLRAHDTR